MVRQRKGSKSASSTATAAPVAVAATRPEVTRTVSAETAQRAYQEAPVKPATWQTYAVPLAAFVLCFAMMQVTSRTVAVTTGKPTQIVSEGMRVFTTALNMHRDGQTHAAMLMLRKYVDEHPRDPEGHYELGLYERMVGQHETAADSNRRALALRRDFPEAYINLGVCQENMGNYSAARATYSMLLNSRPAHFAALASLGSLSVMEGKMDEANDFFRMALQAREDTGVRIRQAIIMAPVHSSFEEMQGRRDRVTSNIKHLSLMSGIHLQRDALLDVNMVPYFLPYSGINNIVQMRMLYRAMAKADPTLMYTAAHLNSSRPLDLSVLPLSGNRIRVGIMSRNLRDTNVGKMVQGFVKYLPRKHIELFVILPPQSQDNITRSILRMADQTVHLPYSLTLARQIVGDLKLHALMMPDCAADPFTYYMAFARLAPVQSTTLAYPGTTGISTVDHFVSFHDVEPESNQVFYTEKLLSLPGLGSRYVYEEPEGRVPSRAFFGLSETDHVYFVPMEVHKVHASFDQMLINILLQDNDAKIALVEPKFAHWQQTLVQRLANANYAPADTRLRIVFFPAAPTRRFLNFYSLVDVVLDTYPMGGDSCVREAISMGKPVVTLPTMAASGSFAKSYLNRIGASELIASSVDTYVRTAVRLNTDSIFRARITQTINLNRFLIYNDQQSMDEWSTYFVNSVKDVVRDLPFGKHPEW